MADTVLKTVVPMEVGSSDQVFEFDLGTQEIDMEVATAINTMAGEHYEGATEVTPAEETQVLDTDGMIVDDSITVLPIPSNYGRIAWNGSVLMVY